MDKIIGTVLIMGLVIFLFLGVFSGSIGPAVETQGKTVGTQIQNSKIIPGS